jgi:hypothetical protein
MAATHLQNLPYGSYFWPLMPCELINPETEDRIWLWELEKVPESGLTSQIPHRLLHVQQNLTVANELRTLITTRAPIFS